MGRRDSFSKPREKADRPGQELRGGLTGIEGSFTMPHERQERNILAVITRSLLNSSTNYHRAASWTNILISDVVHASPKMAREIQSFSDVVEKTPHVTGLLCLER